MKQFKKCIFGLVAFILVGTTSVVHAAPVLLSKAAELSLHRVERLVILKKISESFVLKFQGLTVEKLIVQAPGDPQFKTTVRQYPGDDGTRKALELLLDESGKTLSHKVIEGKEAAIVPVWPAKDAISLSENSLHFVEEEGSKITEVIPFGSAFYSLSIVQLKHNDGTVSAKVVVKSLESTSLLNVFLKSDGTFEKYDLTALVPTFTSIKRNILIPRCITCHSVGGVADNIPLEHLSEILDSPYEVVIPKNSKESGIVIATSRVDEKRMPPPMVSTMPLLPEEIDVIKQWIDLGAPE